MSIPCKVTLAEMNQYRVDEMDRALQRAQEHLADARVALKKGKMNSKLGRARHDDWR